MVSENKKYDIANEVLNIFGGPTVLVDSQNVQDHCPVCKIDPAC